MNGSAGPFRPPRVLDTGFVELVLVDPIPSLEGSLSGDPVRTRLALEAAISIAESMQIRTELQPTKVYSRGPEGDLRLVRLLLPIPGTQQLRSAAQAAAPKRGRKFGGKFNRKRSKR